MFRQYHFIPTEAKFTKAAALKYLSTKISEVNECHKTGKKCMQFGSVTSQKHLYKHKLWGEDAEHIYRLATKTLGHEPKSKTELKRWLEHVYKPGWTPAKALRHLTKI